MSFLLAALAFGLLIAFHELGHMWVAKKTGMRVDRFSIGFGPVVFARKLGETEYAISAIPLGGYVKIAGMASDEEDARDTDPNDPRHFMNRPAWARLVTIAAGPLANYVLAFLIGVPLLMVANTIPDLGSTRVGRVLRGGPAAEAVLKPGDEIKAVDGHPVLRDANGTKVQDFEALQQVIQASARAKPGERLPFDVVRDGQLTTVMIAPIEGRIGVEPATRREPGLSLLQAIPRSLQKIGTESLRSITSLGALFSGRAKVSDLSGPIGMISMTAAQAKKGLVDYVEIVWTLSIAIGFFNLLPIPALDGGRALFLLVELVSRRRVNQRVEGWFHTVGIVALLALIAFVSYADIVRKLKGG